MLGKRDLAAQAWRDQTHFVTAFELDLHGRRAALDKGRETNIYFVCELEDDGPWKVGIADNPVARLSQMQVSTPRPLGLFAAAPATNTLEKYVHHVLRRERLRGEWFRPGPRTLVLAELFLSAAEQASMMVGQDSEVDAGTTLACLAFHVDEALAWKKRSAA